MSIGRLHDILTASIAQVHAEDVVDTERTFAEALEDDLSGLSELVLKGQADKFRTQVQKKHLSANVTLHDMAKCDRITLTSVCRREELQVATVGDMLEPVKDH
ncbi:hypothetical protein H310_04320 [Aphanomyces invadans]|uniref:Uncharacterized protein n=1 Tax=Aphanomyces invadans TaxID=157072 RepID=A0A024UCJ3_9STRA|nr:hypothetical protein H310_04320 [Aphanomyces invadans]ETW03895.1 hypothetical protein H310_04320 [Aphanomyces invadans]|eukprot:XP_008866851.1 hypothetical protein H310_04320 [Aphanomyces invadans]